MASANNDDNTCIMKVLDEFYSTDSKLPFLLPPTKLVFSTPTFNEASKRSFAELDSSVVSKSTSTVDLETEESPAKKFKESLEPHPWELQKLKAELLGAKTDISCLEQQVERLHKVRKELEATFQSEKAILTSKLNKEKAKVEKLKIDLSKREKKSAENHNEQSELNTSLTRKTIKLEKELIDLRMQNKALKLKVEELEHKSRNSEYESKQNIAELEFQVTKVTEEIISYKQANVDLQTKLNKANAIVFNKDESELKTRALEEKVADLQEKLKKIEKNEEYINTNIKKIHDYSSLQREIDCLREANIKRRNDLGHKLLLEEEVETLKTDLNAVKEREKELLASLYSAQNAEKLLDEFQKFVKTVWTDIHVESHDLVKAVRNKIQIMQDKEVGLVLNVSELERRIKAAEVKKTSLERELSDMKSKLEQQNKTIEEQHSLVRRLQKKVFLLSRERDSYRSLLETYEKDLTMSPEANVSPEILQKLHAQLEAKEKSLNACQEMVEELESKAEKMKSLNLEGKLQKLESERNKLLAEKETLLQRNNELEKRLEDSIQDSQEEKIVTVPCIIHPMYLTLENKYQETQKECQHLQQLVEQFKAGEELNETRLLTTAQEVEELQNKLKNADIKYQRMTEIFRKSSKEFRDACYHILGYSIDRIQDQLFKLTSIYARSSHDYLKFQVVEDRVNLIETPYSSTVGELVTLHLEQHHSFPMFLGAITAQLFKDQTVIAPEASQTSSANESKSMET